MKKAKIGRQSAYEIRRTNSCVSVVIGIKPSELAKIKRGQVLLEKVGTNGTYIVYMKKR